MLRRLKNAATFLLLPVVFFGAVAAGMWYLLSPTTYHFNDSRLVVPFGTFSLDQRQKGYGVVIQSGANVTVYNDSEEWRTLTVSYRTPSSGILNKHGFEDLPPKSSKTFGADSTAYIGMHVSVSDYAQRKRDEAAK